MQTIPVNCNRCGASVEVGADTRYVTCSHCRTPLAVIRTPTSVFTDVAARQKELERIDREWEEEKQRDHSWRDKNGALRTWDEMLEPAIVCAALAGFGFLLCLIFIIKDKRFEALPLLFLALVPFGLYLWYASRKARRYWRAEARYRERRFAAEQQPWNTPAS